MQMKYFYENQFRQICTYISLSDLNKINIKSKHVMDITFVSYDKFLYLYIFSHKKTLITNNNIYIVCAWDY